MGYTRVSRQEKAEPAPPPHHLRLSGLPALEGSERVIPPRPPPGIKAKVPLLPPPWRSRLPLPPPMFWSAAYPEESKLASHPPIKPEGTRLAKLEKAERVSHLHHPLSSDLPTLTMVLEDIQPICHGTRNVLTDILVC